MEYFGFLTWIESDDVIGPQFGECLRVLRQRRSDVLGVHLLDGGHVLRVPVGGLGR